MTAVLIAAGSPNCTARQPRTRASQIAPLYPAVPEYFRSSQVPLLAIRGSRDEIFGPAGATAFARDLPDAEIHLIDGGHFLLESALGTLVGHLRGFLGRTLGPTHAAAA